MPTTILASEKTLGQIGFSKLRAALAQRCSSEVAAAALGQLVPPALDQGALKMLQVVYELQGLRERGDPVPLGSLGDVRPLLERTRRAGVLDGRELLQVARLAQEFSDLRVFEQAHRAELPLSRGIFEGLPELRDLGEEIRWCIDDEGLVQDQASFELAEVRQRLQGVSRGIRERIDTMTRDKALAPFLQEPWYTLREHRFVLPVIAEKQSLVKGIVHDVSRSGETVFIEPQELVEANNRLKMLADEAHRLEEAVLADLSRKVEAGAEELERGLTLGHELDGLCARARLGEDLNGKVPTLGWPLALRGTRNPLMLLQGQAVVPCDLLLPLGKKAVVVSGPNAGGKSVLLSTVGNCVLLAACGVPIPASADSSLPAFKGLRVVMGDLQSVEERLSTFSGHIAELARLSRETGPEDLVLIDEIVTGTEAEQGGALAAAFLEDLVAQAGCILVSTHHQKLKALGLAHGAFENGAFGLDPANGKPNFQFSLGSPGASSPLPLAESLGMKASVMSRARELLGGKDDLLAGALARLHEKTTEVETATAKAVAAREAAEALERKHRAGLVRIEKEAKRLVEEKVDEALGEVREALATVRQLVSSIQKGENRPGFIELRRRAVTEVEKKLEDRAAELKAARNVGAASIPEDSTLKVGERVLLTRLGQEGIIQGGPDNSGYYRVRIGGLSTQASRTELMLPPMDKVRPATLQTSFTVQADTRTPTQTDLRGMTVEEAIAELTRAMDSALLCGNICLRVIHGHGTGRLKDAIRKELKRWKQVVAQKPGSRGEGGDGVTIVWFEEPPKVDADQLPPM
jgi:DNA mismatch repair protein MutS2